MTPNEILEKVIRAVERSRIDADVMVHSEYSTITSVERVHIIDADCFIEALRRELEDEIKEAKD